MQFSSLPPSCLLLGILVITPSGLSAQTTTDESANEPTYSIGDVNTVASRVYAHVFKKTSLGHEHAVEGLVTRGHIILDAPSRAGEIVFDMRSFQADTLAARKYIGLEGSTDASTQKQVNANMLGAGVLNVTKYPTATFKIDSITQVAKKSRRGLPQYRLAGQFTLHGSQRPLTVLADAEVKNGWTHLRGRFNIKQSSYGVKPFTKAFGMIGIADQLTIHGDLWFAGTPQQLAQRHETKR